MEGINQGMQNVSGANPKSSIGLGAMDAAVKDAGFNPKDFSKAGLDKPMQTATIFGGCWGLRCNIGSGGKG